MMEGKKDLAILTSLSGVGPGISEFGDFSHPWGRCPVSRNRVKGASERGASWGILLLNYPSTVRRRERG